jgi:hypothetical protein
MADTSIERANQSSKDPPMPMDLDMWFAETAEGIDFDWPESLAVERIQIGIAEIVAAILVFAAFVVIARWAISILFSAGCLLPGMNITLYEN